jgi:hypothetical protein
MSKKQTDSGAGIAIAAPSKAVGNRATRGTYNWSALANTITGVALATWVRVDLATLPGTTAAQKQISVHNSLGRRVGKVQTVTEKGFLYIRRVELLTETDNSL